jgi:hypothetical protein
MISSLIYFAGYFIVDKYTCRKRVRVEENELATTYKEKVEINDTGSDSNSESLLGGEDS